MPTAETLPCHCFWLKSWPVNHELRMGPILQPFTPPPPHPTSPSSQQRKGQTLEGGRERPGKLAEYLLWTHRCIPSPPGPGPTDMALPVWAGS